MKIESHIDIQSILLQTTDSLIDNITRLVGENISSAPEVNGSSYPIWVAGTVVYGAVWPIIICFGVFGNILTLIVLSKTKEDPGSTSRFLGCLAVADIMTLASLCTYMVYVWGQLFWPDQYLRWKLNSFSFVKLSNFSERISKCITVALVSERIAAVTWPFRYRAICTPWRITIVIVVIFIIVMSTTFPITISIFMFDYDTASSSNVYPTTDIEARQFLEFLQSKITTLHMLLNRFIFDLLPIPLVMIGNFIIIYQLRKKKGHLTKLVTAIEAQQQRYAHERRITNLLLAVSFMFLILCGPFEICTLFVLVTHDSQNSSANNSVVFIAECFKTLPLLNSSINFIIYAVVNKNYREGYKAILYLCRPGGDRVGSSGTHAQMPKKEEVMEKNEVSPHDSSPQVTL